MTLTELRSRHPTFVYQDYHASVTALGLTITFDFLLEPDIEFHPTVTIRGVTEDQWQQLPPKLQDAWGFNLGLAEIPSYWKAAASPKIVVAAGELSATQLRWWHQLLMEGMGEYFYRNQIDFTPSDFVTWHNGSQSHSHQKQQIAHVGKNAEPITPSTPTHELLVPVGGGKDSALTTCLFKKHNLDFGVFLLNPTPAMKKITSDINPELRIVAERTIDPKLLELNQQGYLNGHVPFSAYLGFLSRFAGVIFGYRSVAISNERSSNEGNVEFHQHTINHQWSKTYQFEQAFATYLTDQQLVPWNTAPVPPYFSFLRPLYELQISQLLTHCQSFAEIKHQFRSCNQGQKTNSWCGHCSKCLFTYVSLYPFTNTGETDAGKTNEMVEIFGSDLFMDKSLLDEAKALLGVSETKPFECVGTHEESVAAFYLSIKKIRDAKQELPPLLNLVWEQVLSHQDNLDERAHSILSAWNKNHQLSPSFAKILRKELEDV